jgi:butyrate kinase
MSRSYRILAINPGSTSTKVAVFDNEKTVFSISVAHSTGELSKFKRIIDQLDYRLKAIKTILQENNVDLKQIDGVVGRGGLLRPIPGGTYAVNPKMLKDLKQAKPGEHASNLGGIIAHYLGKVVGIPAFIVDPVVVDEMEPLARFSGHPKIERRSIFHALNQKAAARKATLDLGKLYEKLNLIVVHLGGGISIGCHMKGKVVDVNNAFNGDGPFAPERSGGLPSGQLAELCFSGQYRLEEVEKMLVGQGGMVAYLGTNDMKEVENRVKSGDKYAKQVVGAMAYQVAKTIGSMAAVMKGHVDGIVLTGGLARDKEFVRMIREKVSWIGRILIYPGEFEMLALAQGALKALQNKKFILKY